MGGYAIGYMPANIHLLFFRAALNSPWRPGHIDCSLKKRKRNIIVIPESTEPTDVFRGIFRRESGLLPESCAPTINQSVVCRTFEQSAASACMPQIAPLLQERILDGTPWKRRPVEASPGILQSADKVFSSVWIDRSHVLVGTKCSRLILVDVEAPQKSHEIMATRLSDSTLYDYSATRFTVPTSSTRFGRTLHRGIHSVAMNTSGTLLVSTGHTPLAVNVFELPSFKPVQ